MLISGPTKLPALLVSQASARSKLDLLLLKSLDEH
jgi:hypothetical protein